MSTIYRKTERGQAEVETRADRLPPRLRAALILVDGRRSDDELAKLVSTEAAQLLRSLQADGYIEPLAAAPAKPAAGPSSASGLLALPPSAVASIKRDAVRSLTDQIGPMAEALALKIERASNAAELQGLLEIARQVLGDTRGRAAGDAFAQRFLAALPA